MTLCRQIHNGKIVNDLIQIYFPARWGQSAAVYPAQHKNSLSINSSDTSITKAMQMDYVIPASKIASLSSGEFVGMVADNPEERIKLKMFHAEIQNDHSAIDVEEKAYKEIPVVRTLGSMDVEENYKRIKQDIADLLRTECQKQNSDTEVHKGYNKKSEMSNGEGYQQTISY